MTRTFRTRRAVKSKARAQSRSRSAAEMRVYVLPNAWDTVDCHLFPIRRNLELARNGIDVSESVLPHAYLKDLKNEEPAGLELQ